MSNGAITNFCKDGGSGMSECQVAGKTYEVQKSCSFCKKSSELNRCRFEVFGEFCGRVAAQWQAKGKPIMFHEVNGYEEREVENLWGDHFKEAVDDIMQHKPGMATNEEGQTIKEIHSAWQSREDQELLFIDKAGEIHNVAKGRSLDATSKRMKERIAYEDLQGTGGLKGHESDHEYAKRHGLVYESGPGHNFARILKSRSKVESKISNNPCKASFTDHQEWDYIHSRILSPGNIMERYHEGLIVVVSSEKVLTHPMPRDNHRNLLLDTEYLVLYDPYGKLDLFASRDFLHYKAYMWRKLVPKDALPKHRVADFGFHRAVMLEDNSGSMNSEQMSKIIDHVKEVVEEAGEIEEVKFDFNDIEF